MCSLGTIPKARRGLAPGTWQEGSGPRLDHGSGRSSALGCLIFLPPTPYLPCQNAAGPQAVPKPCPRPGTGGRPARHSHDSSANAEELPGGGGAPGEAATSFPRPRPSPKHLNIARALPLSFSSLPVSLKEGMWGLQRCSQIPGIRGLRASSGSACCAAALTT